MFPERGSGPPNPADFSPSLTGPSALPWRRLGRARRPAQGPAHPLQGVRMRPVSISIPIFLAATAVWAAGESLRGRLLDCASLDSAGSGKGVAGARLTLYDAAGKKVAVKISAKSGTYAFAKLAPGEYVLAIDRKDFLPSPLLRAVTLGLDDTLARDFSLDRIPMQGGIPIRRIGVARKRLPAKKRGAAGESASPEYYPRLAAGMLTAMGKPELHREAVANRLTLSRFFDAEDTTRAYRNLWATLLWADAAAQKRPLEADVYLAHAFDSVLRAADIEPPAALRPYLKVPADSMESLSLAVRAMLLAPSKKMTAEALAKKQVPRAMVAQIIEAQAASKAVPKAKRKAFLAKVKNLIGPEAARRLYALNEAPKRKAAVPKNAPAEAPQPDGEAIRKAIVELAGGRDPNPLAVYHLALGKFEQGQPREALAGLERLASLRPDYPQAILAMARCRLALADTVQAERMFDSLSRSESPAWQARGFRGLAGIRWLSGNGEKAEGALWRSQGLDPQSPEARRALFLLAEITLTRDTWNPVEALLDTLIKTHPREAEGHFWLGRMALKRQQDGVALEHFQRASALAPQRPDFAAALAGTYFAREEWDAALKTLRPLRAKLSGEGLSIYGQCLLRQGKAKEAVEEFARLQAAHPSPQNLVQWARALSACGEGKRAVTVIQASSFSNDFDVRKVLAAAEIDQGSADQAKQLLQTLEASKENDAELHFLLGRAAYALREYPDASKQFTSALQYQEDYPEAEYRQGLCLLKLGRSGESHHYFQDLTDSDKPSWQAKGWLGQGQAFAKEEKPEAAAENLRRSFQAAATAEAAAHLALAYLRMNQADEAAIWAAKARKLDPDEPMGLMAAVDALLAKHQEADAVALAQAGLDRHPEACDFLVVAAKAHLRAGHDRQAKDLSQQARDRCPEESAPYFYLGTLSARAGTLAEARRHFGDYMRTGGDARRVPEGYR